MKKSLLLVIALTLVTMAAVLIPLATSTPLIETVIEADHGPEAVVQLDAGRPFYLLRLSARVIGPGRHARLVLVGELPARMEIFDLGAIFNGISALQQAPDGTQGVELRAEEQLELLVLLRPVGVPLGTQPGQPLPNCCQIEAGKTAPPGNRGALVLIDNETSRQLWVLPLQLKETS